MAFDAFMYFPSPKIPVPGETQDGVMKEKAAFELKSFEFGAENTINIGSSSGGGGAGKATFKEFNITKTTDAASCGLFTCLCTGNHFQDAIIELRRSGGATDASGVTFMKFTFKLVMVQDITWSGTDGDDVCEENVVFQYGAMHIEYWRQKKDGTAGDKTEAKWSRTLNKATDLVE